MPEAGQQAARANRRTPGGRRWVPSAVVLADLDTQLMLQAQAGNREAANALLGRIAAKFENQKPAEGYDIGECYDLVHHQPKEAYSDIYGRVKAELRGMGLTKLIC